MIWPVSLYRGARDNRPKAASWSWAGLRWALSVPVIVAEKLSAPAWSPATYPPRALRRKAEVAAVSALVLDHDSGLSIAAGLSAWADYALLWHTSYSHSPERPRYRIVLPLRSPIAGADWAHIWPWVRSRSPEIDRACSDPSRLYFLPAVPRSAAPFLADEQFGELLDLSEVCAAAIKVAARPRRKPIRVRSERQADRLLADRLATDGALRLAVAERVGAKIADNRACAIRCPSCGRAAVWYLIQPALSGGRWAQCNHKRSCAWYGSLGELT